MSFKPGDLIEFQASLNPNDFLKGRLVRKIFDAVWKIDVTPDKDKLIMAWCRYIHESKIRRIK